MTFLYYKGNRTLQKTDGNRKSMYLSIQSGSKRRVVPHVISCIEAAILLTRMTIIVRRGRRATYGLTSRGPGGKSGALKATKCLKPQRGKKTEPGKPI